MLRVRRLAPLVAVAFVLGVLATTSSAASNTTAAQLTKRFKAATGQKLVANKQLAYPGHYVAYDLGVPTAAKRAIWGTFTVYLVTGADLDAEVNGLLADTHTGMLGTPSPGGIYWEQGATLQGVTYWQAKRRYGSNVVLTWIGSTAAKKTDATWKRLHKALTAATK